MRLSFIGWAVAATLAGLSAGPLAGHAAGPAAEAASPAKTSPAPSFSCAKAPGVDEQLICATPLLQNADTDLSTAYRAALAASTVPAHVASLKADERSWIVERNSECQISKYTVLTDQTRPGYIDCFLDEYAERIADLEQMTQRPTIDPTAVSHPIRKSFLDNSSTTAALPDGVAFTTIDIPSDSTKLPVFAWGRDGALLILALRQNGEGVLSSWRPGAPKTLATIPQAVRFSRVCVLGDGTPVLVGDRGDEVGVVSASGGFQVIDWSKLTPRIMHGCGLDLSTLLVSNGGDTILTLGPSRLGAPSTQRFVSLTAGAGPQMVKPPVRIDARIHLRGTFLPQVGKFVVSAADRLPEMQGAVERRWSKTNCLPYWLIAPDNGEAGEACIPFGPYVRAVPQPLPTRSGVFFAADSYGLYRVSGDSAQQVLSGAIEQPVVSNDGCAVAFAVAAGTGMIANRNGLLIVMNACPAVKATN
ncbi:MAG TPA: lysozyme inhibitor LprI family protein [Aliidongia sp.]|uniref:lysozyme inhibitor LprI family protein n=1 Tax=Aliidongia sp. TaxID=1914230 RepID=UPI002DDCAB3C|nr:lysozyme inhibitor LprI family protein [Aliidongia sp.]HEV2675485.1 lysozyme inhibitor LprI family protein [Aliidongia sp.]